MVARCVCLVLCLALSLPAQWSQPVPPEEAPPASETVRIASSTAGSHAASPTASDDAASPTHGEAAVKADVAQPLSPSEEEALEARAEQPDPAVTGGAMSNQHLTYAVIALAAIVLVLIAQ